MNGIKKTFICPVCGAEAPAKAAACPDCGADENTGWNETQTTYDGLDLPEPEFDYDAFIKREFGKPPHPTKLRFNLRFWTAIIALILALAIFLAYGS